MGMAHSVGEMPWNHSCMNTITLKEFVALSMSRLSWSRRYIIIQTMWHGSNLKASLTWGRDYIKTHIVPDNEKNEALVAIHSQTLPAKNNLKYY